jgi:hypothetical protein
MGPRRRHVKDAKGAHRHRSRSAGLISVVGIRAGIRAHRAQEIRVGSRYPRTRPSLNRRTPVNTGDETLTVQVLPAGVLHGRLLAKHWST